MKTELYSISKIFTERLLRIPDYQRGYAWGDKQLKDFWSDLSQLESGHNHYVGVLTLEDVHNDKVVNWKDDTWIIKSKCYEPHYVVDGQQRLTTVVVLIQCILEAIKENNLNYTEPQDIRKKFIFETKDQGISRSYLFGYEVDNPSYEFLKQKIFCEDSDNQLNIQETIYTNNLLNAKEFFLDKLKDMELQWIESLYTKVTQNLLFNIYSMSDEIDVHVSFETMNNRGKSLSHLELLKNRLIYLSTKLDEESYEKLKLRTSINECWKTIYHQLGRNKDNPLDDDVFLFNHFILFFGKSVNNGNSINYRRFRRGYGTNYQEYLLDVKFTTKSLSSDGEEKLTIEELYRYVSSLKTSVEKWYEISNPKGSSLDPEVVKWLEKINRIDSEECLPLIMVSLQKGTAQPLIVKFLTSIERLLFTMMLIRRSFGIDFDASRFIEWASDLSNDETTLEKIIFKMDETRDTLISDKRIINQISDSLKDGGFYRWRGLRYFMYEYEQELKSQSKTYTDKLDWELLSDDIRDHKTIEHIYPQNPRKPCWTSKFKDYSGKERSLLRHSLGNLVPLSHPKNSSFQNKPFLDKVGNSSNTIGFKYGSFSEIELTDNKQWTAVEILHRGIHLLKFMEKRWKIKFDDLAHMVNFLNLGFVLKKEKLKIHNKEIKSDS
ncbi:DUF262 domain-containing protein [Colwellia echini]|uniref:DUF262 domain-containing protein n=1 Tax=Colwellia echini TaxID=1982103 RepID=A0ABY3MSL3_9GAMM|nr:DUF262 domain-containing protein [Colwellia echini]TYK64186.1 DUF262 domain-containing protein [Colwellia echini]